MPAETARELLNAFEADDRGFFVRSGPARLRGERSSPHKLCFTATRVTPLARVLYQLSQRDDCWLVKLDQQPGAHGMVRGRCFLTSDRAVLEVWKQYKATDDLLCTIQNDDFVAPHR